MQVCRVATGSDTTHTSAVHCCRCCPCTPLCSRAARSQPTNGAEVVAARLVQVARGDAATAPKVNPMARLRDTVVFGYLMATPKHGRVDVPDWCAC